MKEEYIILHALGLKRTVQTLHVHQNRHYDVLDVIEIGSIISNNANGTATATPMIRQKQKIYFDVETIYAKFLMNLKEAAAQEKMEKTQLVFTQFAKEQQQAPKK